MPAASQHEQTWKELQGVGYVSDRYWVMIEVEDACGFHLCKPSGVLLADGATPVVFDTTAEAREAADHIENHRKDPSSGRKWPMPLVAEKIQITNGIARVGIYRFSHRKTADRYMIVLRYLP